MTPRLTDEQRRQGFEKSLALRKQRTMLKLEIEAGAVSLAEAFEREEAQGMKVAQLVAARRGTGPKRAQKLLEQVGIPITHTVRRCGPKQLQRLLDTEKPRH